ncbi:DUF1146 family protein [Eremococcus coleocola]|nr:DUF1146 family protein [Eremococcus coleocola]
MMLILNGMAVLIIRLMFVILSYLILSRFNWSFFFVKEDANYARFMLYMLSIALGYLVGSFFIEIIEVVQNIIMSQLL